jgi:hypothetical protein
MPGGISGLNFPAMKIGGLPKICERRMRPAWKNWDYDRNPFCGLRSLWLNEKQSNLTARRGYAPYVATQR